MCDVDSAMLARGLAQVEAAGQLRPKTYVDWRELLEQEKDLAGVVISTPDHLHAPIARAALRRNIAVYCEKPLTRTVEEAQQLQELAKSSGVATQMGTQIHATDNYRRVVEAIRSGAIGDVHTVHVVCRKSWSNGKFSAPKPAPKNLAWDLWLGPTPERPYCDGVHPGNWRRFWAFGTGTVGDMACHWVDLVHWAPRPEDPRGDRGGGPPGGPRGDPCLDACEVVPRRGGGPQGGGCALVGWRLRAGGGTPGGQPCLHREQGPTHLELQLDAGGAHGPLRAVASARSDHRELARAPRRVAERHRKGDAGGAAVSLRLRGPP